MNKSRLASRSSHLVRHVLNSLPHLLSCQVVPLGVGPQGGSGVAASSGSASMAAADRELLEDATALLAYDDPSAGPTGALVGWAH